MRKVKYQLFLVRVFFVYFVININDFEICSTPLTITVNWCLPVFYFRVDIFLNEKYLLTSFVFSE